MSALKFINEARDKISVDAGASDDIQKQCMDEIELLTKFHNELIRKKAKEEAPAIIDEFWRMNNHFC